MTEQMQAALQAALAVCVAAGQLRRSDFALVD